MPNWTVKHQNIDITGYYKNLVGAPVVSFSRVSNGLSCGLAPAGRYRLEVVDGTPDRLVTIRGIGYEETGSPAIASNLPADFGAGNSNTHLFTGFAVSLSPSAAVGDAAEIGIGAVSQKRVLSLGYVLPTLGAHDATPLSVTNVSGETLSLCEVVATNGITITSADSPFEYFVQRGKLSADPDTATGGAEFTFELIPSDEPEDIFSLTLTANDEPEPYGVTATPDEATPAYYASDNDPDTSWTTTSNIDGTTTARWELSLGSERFTCNKLTIYCSDNAGTEPHLIAVSVYFDKGSTQEWQEVVAEAAYTKTDGKIVITWTHPDDTWTCGGYRVDISESLNQGPLEVAEFVFSYVAPSNTYRMLVDGDAVDLLDSIGAPVQGVKTGETYHFADNSKYRSCFFQMATSFDGTETVTISVSDASNFVETSVSPNTGFVRGSDGLTLTGSGQTSGVVANNQTVSFYLRLRSEANSLSVLDKWPFSLRIVGYGTNGHEHTVEHMGWFNVANLQGMLILKANVLQGTYGRQRYSPDPVNLGEFVPDDDGLYVQDTQAPWTYIPASGDPRGGNYKSVEEYLAENGVTIL